MGRKDENSESSLDRVSRDGKSKHARKRIMNTLFGSPRDHREKEAGRF